MTGSLALVLTQSPSLALAMPEPSRGGLAIPLAADCAVSGADSGLHAGIPSPDGYSATRGEISALTLFIDFPDAEAEISTEERFAEFFPATSEYFAESSYGRLSYTAEPLHRWLRMPQPFESYGIDRGVGWHPADPQGYNRLMREIVAAAGDDVDFQEHDLVNILAAPNAGPSAVEKVLSVSFPGRPLVPTASGPLQNVSFIWSSQPGETPHRVLVHENGHSFGLPDLYWTGEGEAPELTGHWDVMEQDWGPSNDLLAWHKWKLEWLADSQVDCVTSPGTSEHLIAPLGADPAPAGRAADTRLVAVPTGPSEVVTLEVRTRTALDSTVCRPGVLLTEVDTSAPSGEGPMRVIDATPGSAGCQSLPDPQVNPGLTDAAYIPGETYRDEENGVRIDVLDADDRGQHRVRVTRW